MRMSFALSGRLLCAGVALLLSAAAGWAEDAVVVSSTAPGQRPGDVISDGKAFTLPPGASATLLFRSGQMLKLRGPYSASLSLPDSEDSLARFASALRIKGVDAAVVGGTREIAPSARIAMSGQDILIDPRRSATYCVGPSDTLWLRRPLEGAELGLRRKQTFRTVSWPMAAPKIEWPGDVTIEDGDIFDLVDVGGKVMAAITFRRLDKPPRAETAWIAQTVLMGCGQQARLALNEVARSSVAPELYLAADDKGGSTYVAGQPIHLVLQSNSDGQLYCLDKSTSNGTVPIFPGAATGGAHIEGHLPLSIPGERIKTDMRVGSLPGQEEIRCYMADRDISAELPPALLDRDLTPLPHDVADALDTIFAAVPVARIVKASLSLRVE
jgi:hypothetical protein